MPASVVELRAPREREHKYILQDGIPTPVQNLMQWATWMENHRRDSHIQSIVNGVRVSTVFLGLDFNSSSVGQPLIWETMTFCKTRISHVRLANFQWRASDKETAHRIHNAVLAILNTGYSVSWKRKRLEEL